MTRVLAEPTADGSARIEHERERAAQRADPMTPVLAEPKTADGSARIEHERERAAQRADPMTRVLAEPTADGSARIEHERERGDPLVTTTVLLHGFLGGPSSWDAVCACLPSSERVLRPSLMGHGRSDWRDAASTFEGEVDRLANALERENTGAVHLVGYSMGARVALVLAMRHPTLVARLTLVSVLPGLQDEDERRVRARLDDALAREIVGGLPAFVARWESLPLFASQRELGADVRARHRAVRLSHDEAALAHALTVLTPGRMPAATPRLGEIATKTLLVAGALDAKFVAVARSIAPLFPDARVRILPDTGHDPTLERPRELAALITENAS